MDDDEVPDYIRQRRKKDLLAPGSQTWGPKLLGFCQQADLLILNAIGRNHELKIPEHYHPVFHVNMLRPCYVQWIQ